MLTEASSASCATHRTGSRKGARTSIQAAATSLNTMLFSQRSTRHPNVSAQEDARECNSSSSAQDRELTTVPHQAASSRSRHTPVAERRLTCHQLACHQCSRVGRLHDRPGSFPLKSGKIPYSWLRPHRCLARRRTTETVT
jgi:hypothetical protein